MYRCYLCGSVELTVIRFRAHLYRHQGAAELKLPILCCQGSCRASLSTVSNFIRHVEKYHNAEHCRPGPADNSVDENLNENNDIEVDAYDNQPMVHAVVSETLLDDIRTEGVSLVAGLRANSSIPYGVIPSIVDCFNHMSSHVTSYAQAVAAESINTAGIDCDVAESLKKVIGEKLESCHEPLDFLSSVYKQDKFFKGRELYVQPESVCLGSRCESHNGTSKLVYDSFQYVSLQKNIQALLKNKSYVEALLSDKRVHGVYENFIDGETAQHHVLFGNCNKFSLMIQLFYDGLGTTNPLRGQSTMNNIGVFFYTIKNLPPKYNSCFANVHLLALCYSEDLKVYGFTSVLEKFIAEINNLQEFGIEVDPPSLGVTTVYASLCQVTCDNLALNGMLGFIESFSADFFCTMCYATKDQIQKCFRAELFQKRTVAEYEIDVENISSARKLGKNHSRGVKMQCVLNRIAGYHVTENWSLDIMHIVLEGIVGFELGCILYGLCTEDRLFDLNIVNQEMNIFWGSMTVGKTEKPPVLTKLQEPGQGLAPSMKAVQLWALVKYLPLVVGKLVPVNNVHWIFLLHLCHLVDLLFAPRFTRGTVQYLADVIEDHLINFTELYTCRWQVKLRPKHHLLVHLPSIVLKSGPLIGMSCMRYELKNSFFKRCAHTVCNFTNICHTLAQRHQQHMLFSLLSNEHMRDVIVVTQQFSVLVSTLAFCDSLYSRFGMESTDTISIANKITVATVQYMVGNCVITDFLQDSDEPCFGKIVSFVCRDDANWLLVLEMLHTDNFYNHFHAFAISDVKPKTFRILAIGELVDFRPLHCCTVLTGTNRKKYIRVPYHVFG